MRRPSVVGAGLGVGLAILAQGCGRSQDFASEARGGRALYERECAVCHGQGGKGDGPAAYLLFPKPRDFTRAYFKIRSTTSGSLPTDEDLFRTITNGMPGSAMPSFDWLSEDDRRALVQVVKGFSEAFEKLEPELLPAPPARPPADATELALGAQKYRELGCWKCHGEKGRGDGPSSEGLFDNWKRPIRANDFTRGIYKGGGSEEDIYLRFASGMDGTPMPSYEGTATPVEIWALVRYVKSLAGEKVAIQPSTGRLVAGRTSGSAPASPDDPRWRDVDAFRVPLMLLWQRKEAIEALGVRALHDGDTLAILLTWEDPTPAWSVLRGEEFADAAAVQFSLATAASHFAMGSTGAAVNIWHWRADRQLDLAQRRSLLEVYPATVTDDYPEALNFTTAADAGNLAASVRLPSAVQDLNAEGFGTLTLQPAPQQNVTGMGIWKSGEWQVLIRRALRSDDRGDVSFSPGRVYPIAFAVWDGDREDRDGQKAVSTWYELEIAR